MILLHSAAAVALAAMARVPVEDIVVDQVDLIEVNHCYDESGTHVFDQVIFYDWSPQRRQYRVRAWRMLKDASQHPYRSVRDGGYESLWHDGNLLRRVRATAYRETWTQHDPELAARADLPREERRQLLTPAALVTGERAAAGSFPRNVAAAP